MRQSRTWLVLLAGTMLLAGGCAFTTLELHEKEPVTVSAKRPHPPKKRVKVEKEKIRVDEKIHFELDSANIKPESHDLLNEIANVINEHEEIEKIEVQGHTDDQGSAQYNKDLSERRADAVVQYLVDEGGVSRDRLISRGFGFDKPIAPNDTPKGRAKNRRVEFHIVERQDSEEGS